MKKKILISIGLLMAISSVACAKSTTVAEFKIYNDLASVKNPINVSGNLSYHYPAGGPSDPSCMQSSSTDFTQSVNKQGTKINFFTATNFNVEKCLTSGNALHAQLNITHVNGKQKTCGKSLLITQGEEFGASIYIRVDKDGFIDCP